MNKKLCLLVIILLVACADQGRGRAEATRVASASAAVVDSIRPVEEEIRRFKAARAGAFARALTGGAASRDELVHDFITALERADTSALRRMVLDAGEFIDLYYPASQFFRPPYQQSPELRWFLLQENSNKGLTRLLRRYGGQPSGFTSYSCTDTPTIEGENRIWDRCRMTWNLSAAPMRAFSTIIERNGHFKIFSYANDL